MKRAGRHHRLQYAPHVLKCTKLGHILEIFCPKALLHCNFLGNLSGNSVARQVAGELHSVNMRCLAFFFLRDALHEAELGSTFRNGLQQLITPLHSVSPLQQLVSQFYGSFIKGACAHFVFRSEHIIARQVAEKPTQCNRASTPNFGNLQRYIFNHCEISCW